MKIPIETLIFKMERLASKRGLILHNILFRRAGVAIEWIHEEQKFVYGYKHNLRAALKSEIERLS
jgi:hypothetical protein